MGSRALVLLAPAFLSACSLLNHLSKSGYHQAVRQKGNKLRVGVRDSRSIPVQKGLMWFGQLQDVDLQSIEPSIRTCREVIIAAIPSHEEPYIKVPKVLKQE
nr:glutamyl-tRNA(Gln) amidotransferase subunit C, chloroplastic/mitochondrial [Tanacetum cinerariifolium]